MSDPTYGTRMYEQETTRILRAVAYISLGIAIPLFIAALLIY